MKPANKHSQPLTPEYIIATYRQVLDGEYYEEGPKLGPKSILQEHIVGSVAKYGFPVYIFSGDLKDVTPEKLCPEDLDILPALYVLNGDGKAGPDVTVLAKEDFPGITKTTMQPTYKGSRMLMQTMPGTQVAQFVTEVSREAAKALNGRKPHENGVATGAGAGALNSDEMSEEEVL